jgi:hypothetical protein
MKEGGAQYTELEVELGRSLTDIVAPAESPFFNDIVVAANSPAQRHKDHTLGFGVPAEMGSIAAVILVLSKPILAFLWENTRDALGHFIKDSSEQVRAAAEKRIAEWIKKRFPKPSPIDVPPDKVDSLIEAIKQQATWPAPGSEDTELGVLMEPEVSHGETEVYAGVQA